MNVKFAASTILAILAAAPVAAQDWGGAYGGVGINYTTGKSKAPWGTAPALSDGDDSHTVRGPGLVGILGYNTQQGNMVYGGELGLGMSTAKGDDDFNSGFENGTDFGIGGYVGGRVGAVSGNSLFYGSLGYAMQRADITEVQTTGGPITEKHSVTHRGPRIALGMDTSLSSGIMRAEISHAIYDSKVVNFAGYDIQSKPKMTQITFAYIMKF